MSSRQASRAARTSGRSRSAARTTFFERVPEGPDGGPQGREGDRDPQLVAELGERGGHAVGLSGVDGAIVRAERYDPRLGLVGRITGVDGEFLRALCDAGAIPVVAPIGFEAPAQALNTNADTVAGEIARAVQASQLVFLTDVDGLLDSEGHLIDRLGSERANALRAEAALGGGMIPKVDACLRAAAAGARAYMANGRQPGTLKRLVDGVTLGTLVEA